MINQEQQPIIPQYHPSVDIAGVIMKGMPWAKATAPMLPVIAISYFISKTMYDLQCLNSKNNSSDLFPTPSAWWTWLISSIVCIVVFLGLTVYHMWKNHTSIT
jgi:hypothetical protein